MYKPSRTVDLIRTWGTILSKNKNVDCTFYSGIENRKIIALQFQLLQVNTGVKSTEKYSFTEFQLQPLSVQINPGRF